MKISEVAILIDAKVSVEVTDVFLGEVLGVADPTVLAGVAMAELSSDVGVEVIVLKECNLELVVLDRRGGEGEER